jgi:signal peptidase I
MSHNLRSGPLRDVLETVILALVVFLLAREAVQNFQVEGSSMERSLSDNQFVLVNKIAYHELDLGPFDFLIPGKSNGDFLLGGPSRGDVIVFRSPFDTTRDFVKRVIGLPGDVVRIEDGLVFINDIPLAEDDYITARPTYRAPPVTVPPEHYFVLGDNRNASQDSHIFGPIHRGLLVGKVVLRWFPISDIGGAGSRDLVSTDGVVVP